MSDPQSMKGTATKLNLPATPSLLPLPRSNQHGSWTTQISKTYRKNIFDWTVRFPESWKQLLWTPCHSVFVTNRFCWQSSLITCSLDSTAPTPLQTLWNITIILTILKLEHTVTIPAELLLYIHPSFSTCNSLLLKFTYFTQITCLRSHCSILYFVFFNCDFKPVLIHQDSSVNKWRRFHQSRHVRRKLSVYTLFPLT